MAALWLLILGILVAGLFLVTRRPRAIRFAGLSLMLMFSRSCCPSPSRRRVTLPHCLGRKLMRTRFYEEHIKRSAMSLAGSASEVRSAEHPFTYLKLHQAELP
jgi:hypothetical protein